MNPIAQTFIISEPEGGVEVIFVTAVDLYFRNKSSLYGVELQIRETSNGIPTKRVVPYSSMTLSSAQINISENASAATKFAFATPVIIRTNEQYAITISPLAGDPNYDVWVAGLGDNDITNPTIPIYRNNQSGSLLISSDDANFIARPSEDLKYTLYTAAFSSSSGSAVFKNSNADFFTVRDVIGSFRIGEQVVMANNFLSLARLSVSGANTFTIGETIFQSSSGSSPNTAIGKVYFTNTSVVKVSSLGGRFTTAGNTLIVGGTSGKTTTITGAFQNVITVSATNVITVPDVNHSDFANGNLIVIFNNSRANGNVLQIVANTGSSLILSANVSFSDSTALISRVRNDGDLNGVLSSQTRTSYSLFVLGGLMANSTMNFANTSGKFLVGRDSGASANVVSLVDLYYDSVTAQFTDATPRLTSLDWSFRGISNTKSQDSSFIAIPQDIPHEFIDKQRMIMSRSNELKSSLSVGGVSGTSALQAKVQLASANGKVSPYIDTIRNTMTLTHNMIFPENFLNGALINFERESTANGTSTGATGWFAIGDTVWQNSATTNTSATVILANDSFIAVTNLISSNIASIGKFVAGANIYSSNATSNGNANVVSLRIYNEASSPSTDQSRYISKNVILADKQDAEDLVTYLTAYRPAGTNLLVYAQFSNAQDGEPVGSKSWSRMPESAISTGLFSSLVNRDDFVELTYAMPSSYELQSNSVTANTTSNKVNFTAGSTSAGIAPGNYVYLRDVGFGLGAVSVNAAGSGYNTGDIVQAAIGGGSTVANATYIVTANATNNAVSLTLLNPGSFSNNQANAAVVTAFTTGVGTGLTLVVAANSYVRSTKFAVRQVTDVTNTSSIVINSNNGFITGNAAIGLIPGIESIDASFKYTANEDVLRYVSTTGQVYDGYKTFAVKIVLVSNTSYIVPRLNDMRSIALQV